jgi:hypothetical protein
MLDDLLRAYVGPSSIELSGDQFASLLGDAWKQAHSRILRPEEY